MKRRIRKATAIISLLTIGSSVSAQGLHFSQYYQNPLLLSPANAALIPEKDFRAGVSYRNQWAAVPVPYNTFSAYGDFQVLRNRNSGNSWLGLGLAFYNDKVGDGQLSLTRSEGVIAYHVLLNERSLISIGLSAAYCQRSIDFSSLTFDAQWDGFSYSSTLPSGEPGGMVKTTYADAGVGINYAYFPNEYVFVKLNVGATHVNRPKETFYNSENRLGIRPTANVDALFKVNSSFIINPSVYYSQQVNAWELMCGTLIYIVIGDNYAINGQIIAGGFYRWDDAIIATIGYEWHSGIRLLASYDVNTSPLAKGTKGNGAFEFGLSFQGMYSDASKERNMYSCPRF